MKPMRGLSKPWLSLVPKERRSAVVSLALLVGILGSLLFYQRFLTGGPAPGTPSLPLDGGKSPANVAGTVVDAGSNPAAAGSVVAGPPMPPAPALAPTRLQPPLAGEHKVLRSYELYRSRVYADIRTFPGVALAVASGEAVRAAADGTVKALENDPAYGPLVVLEHTGGMTTQYGGVTPQVSPGTVVKAGDPLGAARAVENGDVTGPYLFFGVQVNGEPRDPRLYFPQ